MIEFNAQHYFDDRLFVLEISAVAVPETDGKSRQWAVITRQNIEGFPVFRIDSFDTLDEAVEYARAIEPGTPRISLGGKPPEPAPTLEEYREWLRSIGVWDRYIPE